MIFDKIENIDKYPQIPDYAIKFIKEISKNTPCGKTHFSNGDFANIDEYKTRKHDLCKLEAHRKYIDIQIVLNGKERLDFTSINGLEISEEYDITRDVMFFKKPDRKLNSVMLESGFFVLLYPDEAHQPQMNYDDTSCDIKKAVVKLKV